MVVDGVEVGGDESSPTEAVVGSALLALRGDLSEFEGWQVDVHVDIDATNADGEFQVTRYRVVKQKELDARSSVLFWEQKSRLLGRMRGRLGPRIFVYRFGRELRTRRQEKKISCPGST